MKRNSLISLLLLLGLCSCADKAWRGVEDKDYDDYDNGVPVPVVVAVGDVDVAYTKASGAAEGSSPYTKGTGAVDASEGEGLKDANIYVYAFKRGSSFTSLARSSSSEDCLVDASLDTPSSKAGRKAWYSGDDDYLTWASSSTEIYYPSGRDPYDFFAYYIDGLSEGTVSRTSSRISFPLTIDGSSDVMSARSSLDEAALEGTEFSSIEKKLLVQYAFSAYSARRGVDPVLKFRHHLTRLRFCLYPASEDANTVMVNEITVKSKATGQFTVVSTDENAIGLDFSGTSSRTPLFLTEADGSALQQDHYRTNYSGDFSEDIYQRPSVQVGGSLLVAPDDEYEVTVKMKEAKTRDYYTQTTFTLTMNGGFLASHQYEVRLAIYGMMETRPSVEIEAWGEGGSIRFDEEDKYK